jgi:hypothetical protein
MEVMVNFRNNTVRSRGYEFSEDEMRRFRIKGVYNSMADADYMDTGYVDSFINGCYDPRKGEVSISESAIHTGGEGRGLVRILSVIVFSDAESMELFILANPKLYLTVDRTMNGRMN